MGDLFSQLKGNLQAKEILSIRPCAPVWLFTGPEGVGKRLFAESLARDLLQTLKKEPPDLHILSPEPVSRFYAIASIRQMIQDAGYSPFEASCKVFILDDAHAMLPSSSNALLKTLEEPPANTYIFLISAEIDKILPTIRSRCRKLSFFPIGSADMEAFLKEQRGCPEEEIAEVVRMSEGSIGKALFLLQHRWKEIVENVFQNRSYGSVFLALNHIEEALDGFKEEAKKLKALDALFEQILESVRQQRIEDLDKTLKQVKQARLAILQNVKPRAALEQLFLCSIGSI